MPQYEDFSTVPLMLGEPTKNFTSRVVFNFMKIYNIYALRLLKIICRE